MTLRIDMCGFVGIFNYKTSTNVNSDVIKKMNGLIHHRGPDDEGYYVANCVGFGFKRLSVIDINGGHQPMVSECGRYILLFNGEIYNYKSLREMLGKKGYTFQTSSDTEVILAMVVLGIPNFELELDGMFAISVYDSHKKKLTLYRDRLGKKPLYYSLTSHGVVYSSEIKSILESGFVERKVNWDVVSDFFSLGYTVPEITAIEGIHGLKGGAKIEFSSLGMQETQWWSLKTLPEEEKEENNVLENVETLLYNAVQKRMIADVEVGIYLSGGLDSSLLAGMMTNQNKLKNIKAYTIGFESESYDETSKATEVADLFGLDHRTIKMDSDDFVRNFSDIVYMSDNLNANPAIFANYLLSKKSQGEIKVALNGGGGDELFFGYTTYKADLIANFIPRLPVWLVNLFLNSLSVLKSNHKKLGFKYKLFKFIEGLKYNREKRHYWWRTIFSDKEKENLLSITTKDSFQVYQEKFNQFNGDDFFEAASYADLKVWWSGMGLHQGDAMSMANGIELRMPFMDNELVEFVYKVPRKKKFNGKKLKSILKTIGYNYLPKELLKKPKEGFHLPLAIWYANELRSYLLEKLSKERLLKIPEINIEEVERILTEHLNYEFDNSFKITCLLVFIEWHELFIQNYKKENI